MHLTVYHARRFMPGLEPANEIVNVVVPTAETRFMVLAPGGENPRPELDPAQRKVGIRIQRRNVARSAIQTLRDRVAIHETPNVLGGRRPSTSQRNAFGARNFQPHISLLYAGSGLPTSLNPIGELFRSRIDHLTFDRFSIEIVSKDSSGRSVTT